MMLETQTLYGNISEQASINGLLNLPTEYIEPNVENLTVTPTTNEQIFEPVLGTYYDKVTVNKIYTEQKEVTSSNEDVTVIPSSGKFIDQITVKGDSNLIADNIRKGTSILGVTGTMEGAWDTSQIRQTQFMFYGNTVMTEAPYLDVTNVTDASNMFRKCSELINIPVYDFLNVTTINYMFNGCSVLKDVELNFGENAVSASMAFTSCYLLENVKLNNFIGGNVMASMFSGCRTLEEVSALNAENCTNVSNIFAGCTNLKNFNGLINVGKGYLTSQSANYSPYTFWLGESSLLTYDSLISIINNLYDIASKGCNTQKLAIGETNIAKLTAEEIAIATNKGWTVT